MAVGAGSRGHTCAQFSSLTSSNSGDHSAFTPGLPSTSIPAAGVSRMWMPRKVTVPRTPGTLWLAKPMPTDCDGASIRFFCAAAAAVLARPEA